jgi:RNA polymerase sigma factor (sigma-70 family)
MMPAPPFEEVVARHAAMIRRIAAAHEADAGAREDLVQDILFAVWRALPSFRGEAGLRSFIARVAANRAVTHVQKALRRPACTELSGDLAASDASPETHAIGLDETARLLAAVRALPIGLREPALLALEGLSQTEIAGVLGVTPNAVAIRMSRARLALRKLIGG